MTTATVLTSPFEVALEEMFQAVAWLHMRWNTFDALFAHSSERIALYNCRTGHPFGMFQRVLWDAVLLDIAKLLSKGKSAGHEVVSLGRLIDDLRPTVERSKADSLKQKLTD